MKMNHYLNVPGLLRRFAKIGLALLLVLSVAFGAGAQDVSPARVSGTVVDQQGMPVVGAGVVVRGTQTGSVTDLDGRFTVMAAKDATLTVSFIGYTTREVPVGTQTDIRIVLEENVQSNPVKKHFFRHGPEIRGRLFAIIGKIQGQDYC